MAPNPLTYFSILITISYRNKDMLGEDPFLTASMAVPETKGIQDAGAVATLKHFGVASIGTDMQNAANQRVDEQTLHEIVFPPQKRDAPAVYVLLQQV